MKESYTYGSHFGRTQAVPLAAVTDDKGETRVRHRLVQPAHVQRGHGYLEGLLRNARTRRH